MEQLHPYVIRILFMGISVPKLLVLHSLSKIWIRAWFEDLKFVSSVVRTSMKARWTDEQIAFVPESRAFVELIDTKIRQMS